MYGENSDRGDMAKTQQERKAETRARLLAAAADLFADQGVDAVSVDAVAEAAGRTSGAVYAHFGSKQGLLLALLDSWQDSVRTVLLAEVAVTDSPRGPAGARSGTTSPAGPATDRRRWALLEHELWLRAARDPEVAAVLRARATPRPVDYSARPAGIVEPGRSVRPAGADPEQLAVLVQALLTGLAMQRRLDPDSVTDDLAVRGLAALVGLPPTGRRSPADRRRNQHRSSTDQTSTTHHLRSQTMNTEIRRKLGIEFPIFAFTHCRDVVAAVSNAGGIGVLGAIGFTPEQLEVELTWIDEHVGDHPYGVDIVIPAKYEGMDEMDPDKLEAQIRGLVPPQHKDFALKILADHGVPEIPEERTAAQRDDRLDGRPRRRVSSTWRSAIPTCADRQRPRHSPAGRRRAGAGRRPDDRGAGRVGQARPQPQGGRARLHHLPGLRGRRPHRRRRAASCCGPRWSTLWPRSRSWPPAASAAAARWRRPWRSVPKASGRAPCG